MSSLTPDHQSVLVRSKWALPGLLGVLVVAGGLSGCSSGDDDAGMSEPARIESTIDTAPPTTSSSSDTSTSTTGPVPRSGTVPSSSTTPPASTGPSVEPGSYRGNLEARVLAQHPHDENAFTQGLEWYGDELLETTGLWGESSVRLVDPLSGTVTGVMEVDDSLFAEGTTVVDDQAYVLTWRNQTLLTVDLPALSPTSAQTEAGAYSGEGWGLCHDGTSFVMSDGSDQLVFRHPETFDIERSLGVTLNGEPVESLNELECVGDQVLANVWQSNTILVIAADTGEVEATIDATSLVPDGYAGDSDRVLNGIAFNEETGRLWLTGKRWPVLYEVELVIT
jgi:glutaminyl-peptide cyclotransferase